MTDLGGGVAAIVLVVEDETLVRLLANDILTEAGYRVLEAHDGQEALTILEVHDSISVLFTDVSMPNVDGLSLVKIVGQRWPEIRVVLTSALALPSGPAAGTRFVPKPYTARTVLQEIEAALDRDVARSAAPVALMSIPNLTAGHMHGAGGLAQPLRKPEE